MSAALRTRPQVETRTAAFARVLCGIDASRSSPEVARQAVALAEPGGEITFLSVTYTAGIGLTRGSVLSEGRAQSALDAALEITKCREVTATTATVASEHPARVLLDAAADYDLLALAGHRFSRMGGVMLGSTSSEAVHRAPVPVLVARAPRDAGAFPGRVLIATDGSRSAGEAVRIGGRIAAAWDQPALLAVIEEKGYFRQPIARDAAALIAATGREPVVIVEHGAPYRVIPEIALREDVSLIVLGSRGLGGLRALSSVSERVVHAAHCSVLVARQPAV